MKILGIDPGTAVLGYGIIETDGQTTTLVLYDVIRCRAADSMPTRLLNLFESLREVIRLHRPDEVAVESPFFAKNARSALAVGKAQAVAMLAAAQANLPVFEYSPAQIKSRVTDYGAGSKDQVALMVKLELGLTEIPYPADAADALACALCHLREKALSDLLKQSS